MDGPRGKSDPTNRFFFRATKIENIISRNVTNETEKDGQSARKRKAAKSTIDVILIQDAAEMLPFEVVSQSVTKFPTEQDERKKGRNGTKRVVTA